jgi:hypothetical protein
MQLNYAGTITKQQYLDSLSLNQAGQFKSYRLFCGLFLALMIISVIVVVVQESPSPEAVMQYASGLVFLAVVLTAPWWAVYLQRNGYGRFYDANKKLFSNLFGVVDDAGFTINTRNTQGQYSWSDITDIKEGRGLLLLCHGKYRSQIFTPEFFSSSEDWEQFVSFSKEKVALNKRRTGS